MQSYSESLNFDELNVALATDAFSSSSLTRRKKNALFSMS